jgi:rhodanese-related sulfurtransferase
VRNSRLASGLRLYTFHVLLGLFVVVIAQVNCVREEPLDWDQVASLIDSEFPGLPTLTTAELQSVLSSDRPVLLLDVRTPEEFAISHLQGAHQTDSTETAVATVAMTDPGALVVAYCSVGYRSAALVQQLRDRGIDAVNLEGSIFQWANENRPVYRGPGPVTEVHPFDDSWGTLLERNLWAYDPSMAR